MRLQPKFKTSNTTLQPAEPLNLEATEMFVNTTITNTTWAIPQNQPLLRGQLHSPVSGQTVNSHVFEISGWVLEQDNPLAVIEVMLGDEILSETKLDAERKETRRIYPLAPDSHHGGFRVPMNALILPEEFELQVYAMLSDGSKEKLGEISGKRSPVTLAYKPSLQPITVIGMPRSGTTLLMNYLSNHPSIITHKSYPYEFMVLSYWMHCFRVLGARADLAHSSFPNSYLRDPYFIGHHPHFSQDFGSKIESWFQEDYVPKLLTFCLQSIESCYQQIAASQNKHDTRYFAEKLHRPTTTYHLQWSLYPQSRSILIVRDFRDQYCSALAFTAKLGFDELLPGDLEEELKIVKRVRKDFMRYYNVWKRYPEQVHIVRYEDLVLNPGKTLATLFKQLGLAIDDATLDKLLADTNRDTQGYTEHRTTKSSVDSIGRWQTDLSPHINALYQTYLGEILTEFGYEV